MTNHANNALALAALARPYVLALANFAAVLDPMRCVNDVEELTAELVELLNSLDRRLHAIVGLAVEPPLSLELEEMHASQLELGCPGCQNGGGDRWEITDTGRAFLQEG